MPISRIPGLSREKISFAFACLILLQGCSSPKPQIRSRKDPAYTGKLERVLVIYHNERDAAASLGRGFADRFLGRLSELLAQKGVVSEVARPAAEDLDETAPVELAAARFRPRQALHFGLTRVISRSGVSRDSFDDLPSFAHDTFVCFSVSLYDVPRQRTVWRGELSYQVPPDASAVADQLLERFETEQLIGQLPAGAQAAPR